MNQRFLFVVLLLFLAPGFLQAHGLGATWKVSGDKLLIEAYFDDDSEAQDAKVQLLDKQEKVVAQAKTDARGQCALPAPSPGNYHLVIDAGAGHRHREELVIPENPAANQESTAPKREDKARILWTRAAIVVAILAAFAFASWFSMRQRNRAS